MPLVFNPILEEQLGNFLTVVSDSPWKIYKVPSVLLVTNSIHLTRDMEVVVVRMGRD